MILAFDTATSFGAVCGVSTGAREPRRAGRRRPCRRRPARRATRRASRGSSSAAGPAASRASASASRSRARSPLALDVPVAGASTLDAFRGGTARDRRAARRGVRARAACLPRRRSSTWPGKTLVGDGAIRYRDVFEAAGATIPPDDDRRHLPDPLLLVERAGPFGAAELVEPLYVREPDARPSA